jgi:putative AbiEi antitoxin of type IV toxin-antitoxin system
MTASEVKTCYLVGSLSFIFGQKGHFGGCSAVIVPLMLPTRIVKMIPLWNYIDTSSEEPHTAHMPHSRMDELSELADGNDGLFTSKLARDKGIKDSVLVRLAQRGRLVRTTRGV